MNPHFKKPLDNKALPLSRLQVQVQAQGELLNQIRMFLPDAIGQQIVHCLCQNSTLLLYVNNASSASVVRFYSEQLRRIISNNFQQHLRAVRVRLLSTTIQTAPARKATRPTQEVITQLYKDSSTIEDLPIQQALRHLIDRLNQAN